MLKVLGVTLDSTLTFDDHANNVVRSCNFHVRALWHLCPRLSLDVAKTMTASIVGSRLDYCNALYYGAAQSTMNKLQRVQNNLARVVCDVSWRQAHSADLLRDFHWLPVRNLQSSKLRHCVIDHASMVNRHTFQVPLVPYTPSRNLRSSNSDRLNEPLARHATGERRFSHYAPRVCNSLPITVRSASTLDTFKARLKTYLY